MKSRKWLKTGGIIIIALMALYMGFAVYSGMTYTDYEGNMIDVYFYNHLTNELQPERCALPEGDYNDVAEYLWGLLAIGPKSQSLTKVFPEGISNDSVEQLRIVRNSGEDTGFRNIEVYMKEDYYTASPAQEIVFRSAVVWTFTELEWVNEVLFKVGGMELQRIDGSPVGPMSRDNVLINAQITKEKVIRKTVMLYFADENLTGLVAERRMIEVPSNVSEEKIVLQELLKGPHADDLLAVIPPETVINEVNTESMICFVDLNAAFDNKLLPGTAARRLAVYSIVNTLTGLTKGDVEKVQFLQNAERLAGKNLEVDLSQAFEMNEGIIIKRSYDDFM